MQKTPGSTRRPFASGNGATFRNEPLPNVAGRNKLSDVGSDAVTKTGTGRKFRALGTASSKHPRIKTQLPGRIDWSRITEDRAVVSRKRFGIAIAQARNMTNFMERSFDWTK